MTTNKRTSLLPDVPTMAESGFKGARVEAWSGFFLPAGTPRPIVDKLAAALKTTLAKPELKAKLAAVGFEVQPGSPEEFGKRVATDVAQWRVLTKQAGLEPR